MLFERLLYLLHVLEQADIILAPDTGKADKTALHIIRDHLNGKTPILVPTPMTRDKALVEQAYEAAAQKIIAYLEEGRQVAFITLGDPTVYSTYMYIHEKVRARGFNVEVVPGVPSFCAAAARLNISLCQGAEPLLVIRHSGAEKRIGRKEYAGQCRHGGKLQHGK